MRVVSLRSASEQTSGTASAAIALPNANHTLAAAQSRNAVAQRERRRRFGRVCALTAAVSSDWPPMSAASTDNRQLRTSAILSMCTSYFGCDLDLRLHSTWACD